MRDPGFTGDTDPVRRGILYVLLTGAVALACENLDGLSGGNNTSASTEDRSKDSGGKGQNLPGSPQVIDASGPRCDPTKAFEPPELVSEFDGEAKTKAAIMTPDELEAFYLVDGGGSGWDLRHATRTSLGGDWTIVTETPSPPADDWLSLSVGGKKLYYWLLDTGVNPPQAKVFSATRSSLGAPFGTSKFVSSPEGRPIIAVDSDDVGFTHVFETPAGATVANPQIKSGPLSGAGLNNLADIGINDRDKYDTNPVINLDQTVLYFASLREPTMGGDDVWVSHRPSRTAVWGPPERVVELSTATTDRVTWISNDECVALLTRSQHVFIARRPL